MNPTGGRRTVSQITSRRRRNGIFVAPFAKTAQTSRNLELLLLAHVNFFDESIELRKWRDRLTTLEVWSNERVAHMQWLFRLGLSLDENNTCFYSFCNKQWTSSDTHRHCATCNRCHALEMSWHCGLCRQCRHEGLDKYCYRCGGSSSTAMSRQEKQIEIWRTRVLTYNSKPEDRDEESPHGSGHPGFSVRPSAEDAVTSSGDSMPSNPGPLAALRLEPSDIRY